MEQQAPVWLSIWSDYLRSFTSHKLAPVELDLLSWLGLVADHGSMPLVLWAQGMDKGLEHAQAPSVAQRLQTRQHGLAIVAVVLLDPPLDLFFERIQFGTSIGTRTRHGDQFRMAQILAYRVPGYSQLDRDVLNGLSLSR